MTIPSFDFDPRTRVVFGPGALSRVGELVYEIGGTQVLLVTDKGLKAAGHEDRAVEYLQAQKLNVHIYDDVHCNPTTADIEAGAAFARDRSIDFIVGLGGGSSMDCAKGINFLLTNGGKMQDYRGVGKATKPMLPLIAIPTTAGTGSEAQSYAVIADAETHMKMACGDKKAAAKVAILDPELTVTMPREVTAVTGIDAISHAIESYVTTRRTPTSKLFSMEAWKLLNSAFPKVLENAHDVDARGAMLLGAHWAGAAIENSMLGATHSLVNPLSAHFDTTHGVAIGIMLPHVVRHNGQDSLVRLLYGELASRVGICSEDDPEAPDKLASRLEELVKISGQPQSLEELDADHNLIPTLATEAAQQWTAQFNPRPVDVVALQELYECAYPTRNA